MSRTELIDVEAAEGERAELFDGVTRMLGRVPNSYRVMAHSPAVASVLLPFNAVLQREGAGSTLPTKIKEMAVIKTSQVNGCRY